MLLAVLSADLTACGGGVHGSGVRTAAARGNGCPATFPNGRTPPGEPSRQEDHGNGTLWTQLPPDGKIVARRNFVLADGSMRIKFPSWGSRRTNGHLGISGISLDRPGQVVRVHISPGLAHAPHFWASGITFPTEGCWRITGNAGSARLTFVVFVVKARSA